ncbi:MAG: adenylate/guanylate cyclase domain-containing protein [Verrucomicrobiae bacterium]|nr:adenylate/guanylate cyclase domain-containing protein [Verrucomicrobiae bacterium]
MTPRLVRKVPLLICGAVLGVVWSLRLSSLWISERAPPRQEAFGFRSVLIEGLGLVERLELGAYDSRMRLASRRAPRIATNLGLVGLDVESLGYTATNDGFSWPLPRYFHAQILEELRQQEVKAVLFDILFADPHYDYQETRRQLPDGSRVSSDAYFARVIGQRPDVILSAFPKPVESGLELPATLFRAPAAAVAHASRIFDLDPVVRRIRPFVDTAVPEGGTARIWHGGFVLAATELGLDLRQSRITRGWITLVDTNGLERIEVPVDSRTNFFIPWLVPAENEALFYENYADLLHAARRRREGQPVDPAWRGRLAIVASVVAGNNVSDLGATPLSANTPLSGVFWNVANSLITAQFVRKPSLAADLALLSLLTLVPAVLSWRLRAWWATGAVALFAAAYVVVAFALFLRTGWMLPVVLPVAGALLMTHVALLTWRGINELLTRSETRSFWRRVLSENVFAAWEKQLTERAGGSHRRVTIAFADLRGFTEMVDESHRLVLEYTQDSKADPEATRAFARHEADESMATINRYLSEIARIFKEHDGTFDKYIGDCVMAFWGAPIPCRSHALSCVLASISAQRRVRELNEERLRENRRREAENGRRAATGQPMQRILPLLAFGVGIHTGEVTVGTLGGGRIVSNYTVFGRDANIASRLEAIAGRGQIVISHATWTDLSRDAPILASQCRPLGHPVLKGIKESIEIYEVPWSEDVPVEVPPARSGNALQ